MERWMMGMLVRVRRRRGIRCCGWWVGVSYVWASGPVGELDFGGYGKTWMESWDMNMDTDTTLLFGASISVDMFVGLAL
jgi:hypothetical protein